MLSRPQGSVLGSLLFCACTCCHWVTSSKNPTHDDAQIGFPVTSNDSSQLKNNKEKLTAYFLKTPSVCEANCKMDVKVMTSELILHVVFQILMVFLVV